MHKLYKSISIFILSLMLPLVGCINDEDLCPIADGDEDRVTVEFSVVTRDVLRTGTRAPQDPVDYNPLSGTMAENYLDLQNTVFMLFDQDQTLVKVFIPEVKPDDNTYAKYSVRAFLSQSEFQTLTEGKTNVQFSIAVVGNYSRLNPMNAAYHIGLKLKDIFDAAKVGTFSMPVSNNPNNSWIPSIYGIGYTDALDETITGLTPAQIPMAGIQTYNVSVEDLAASTVDNPLNLSGNSDDGDIYMLRALAKIEIIDHIDAVTVNDVTTQPDRDERICINKVELIGHTTRGSLFPTINQWDFRNPIETQYVKDTSVPQSSQYVGIIPEEDLTTPNAPTGSIVTFFADKQATELREDGCTVYSCYLTEYNPAELNGSAPMWIRVTAKYPVVDPAFQDYGDDVDTSLFRIEIAPYVNGGIQAAIPVLRNNIYRFQINKVTPPDQYNYITYTVCPMGNYTSDIPTFE